MRSFECSGQERACARRPVLAVPEDTDIYDPNAGQMRHGFNHDAEQKQP